MAHIIYRPTDDGAMQLVINGVDYSDEVYRNLQIVDMAGEVGIQVTFAVGRLDLGGDEDCQVTNQVPEVAERLLCMNKIEYPRSFAGTSDELARIRRSVEQLHRDLTRSAGKRAH